MMIMHISKSECRKLNDDELVSKSLQDIEYFACLFEKYEKKLIHYILRISSYSIEEADDILQDAFLKIWKNLNKFDSNLKFSSWAYRIVHNTTKSRWKKSKSYGRDQHVDIELFKSMLPAKDFAEELDVRNKDMEIRKILNSMPKKYSDVLVLKFLEEKNYNEISDIIKKPAGTVATLIHRAKKAFRKEADKSNIIFEL